MNVLIDKLRELSECVNESIVLKQQVWNKKGEGNWNKFWAAHNALEDAQAAIDEWKLVQNPQRLEMYGVLQALVVQQDALLHLQEAMDVAPINIKTNHPELFDIRVCRHQLVGHPSQTSVGSKSSYLDGTITYTTVGYSKDSKIIEYSIASASKNERKTLVLSEVLPRQEDSICEEITKLISTIESIDNSHKLLFEPGILQKRLQTADYLATKVYSFEHDPEYARMSIDSLTNMYGSFKSDICRMYGVENINDSISVSGLVSEIQKIDKLLPRVSKMLSDRENTDELDLDVYAECLTNSVRLLQKMAKEVDTVFNTNKS